MEDSIKILPAEADVIYGQNKAEIDTQIATAKTYPRTLSRVMDNIVAIVTMDESTAQTCGYALPRGGKTIAGPSVHLAKIIVQQYGNMRIGAKVISIDATTITSQAIAFDLETNVAITVEVKRSIMTKTGRMSEDMIVVTGNAANSIALRNAVFAVVPKAIVDKSYKAAQDTILGDVSSKNKLIAKRKSVIDKLTSSYKITEAEILAVINKPSIDAINAADLTTLIGIGQAILDGDTTVEQAFKKNKTQPKTAEEIEIERISDMAKGCDTIEDLDYVGQSIPEKYQYILETRKKELDGNK